LALLAALALGCRMEYEMEPRPHESGCTAQGYSSDIDWYGPARAGDREKLAEWCSTVGPPVIEATPAPDVVSAPGWETLTVVSWNVHGGSGDLLGFIESELDLNCRGGQPVVGDGFAPFVLVLQEVYRRSKDVPRVGARSTVPSPLKEEARSGERIDVVEVARRCGLSLFYVPSMRNGDTEYEDGREDRGNAILSTLGGGGARRSDRLRGSDAGRRRLQHLVGQGDRDQALPAALPPVAGLGRPADPRELSHRLHLLQGEQRGKGEAGGRLAPPPRRPPQLRPLPPHRQTRFHTLMQRAREARVLPSSIELPATGYRLPATFYYIHATPNPRFQ
jgi:hypothetical protein